MSSKPEVETPENDLGQKRMRWWGGVISLILVTMLAFSYDPAILIGVAFGVLIGIAHEELLFENVEKMVGPTLWGWVQKGRERLKRKPQEPTNTEPAE